jgi:hypothetical protein
VLQDESASTPPFDWLARDIAFVATELSQEFPTTSPEKIAKAIEDAAQSVSVAEGRVSLAIATRRLVRGEASARTPIAS